MRSIAVAILACGVGGVAGVFALLLLRRHGRRGWAWLRSCAGQGSLALLVGGCLLAAGGLYQSVRHFAEVRGAAAKAARLETILQEPLGNLVVSVQGPNPMQDSPDGCTLRLQVAN